MPLPYNGGKWKLAFTATSLQVFWQNVYSDALRSCYGIVYVFLFCSVVRWTNSHRLGSTVILFFFFFFFFFFFVCLFFFVVAQALWLLWQLKVSIDLQWENVKIEINCYLTAQILTKVFSEMFDEWSSTKHIILVQTSQFDWFPWQPKG